MANKGSTVIPRVFFGGVELTRAMEKDLIDIKIIDELEGAADDLQITVADELGIWSAAWLGKYGAAGKEAITSPSEDKYNYSATTELNVRSSPKVRSGNIIGTLKQGEKIYVKEIENGWGQHDFNGQTGYSSIKYLNPIEDKAEGGNGEELKQGDRVSVSGRPKESSYGGREGAVLSEYSGVISIINSKEGIPFPYHIEGKGWVSREQLTVSSVQKTENVSSHSPVAFGKGTKVDVILEQININSKGETAAQGFEGFELDDIEYCGPPSTMSIRATSLPNTSTVKNQEKTRVWEDTTVKEVLNTVAEENGMRAFYDSSQEAKIDRIEQIQQSDILFLQYLAGRFGLALKAAGNMLIMFDKAEYEEKEAVKVYRKRDLTQWRFTTNFNDTSYSSCHVEYTDPDGNKIEYTYTPRVITVPKEGTQYCVTGKNCYMRKEPEVRSGNGIRKIPQGTIVTAKAFENNWIMCIYGGSKGYVSAGSLKLIAEENRGNGQVLEVSEKVSSVEEARQLAVKRLKEKNKEEFTAELTAVGDVTIAAGVNVELDSEFGGWAGKYVIDKITRTINYNGFIDVMELYRPMKE